MGKGKEEDKNAPLNDQPAADKETPLSREDEIVSRYALGVMNIIATDTDYEREYNITLGTINYNYTLEYRAHNNKTGLDALSVKAKSEGSEISVQIKRTSTKVNIETKGNEDAYISILLAGAIAVASFETTMSMQDNSEPES